MWIFGINKNKQNFEKFKNRIKITKWILKERNDNKLKGSIKLYNKSQSIISLINFTKMESS